MKTIMGVLGILGFVAGVGSGVSGACAAGEESAARAQDARRNVAILAFEGVELLDFAGPAEVFQVAAHGTGGYDVQIVGATTDPIVSLGLVTITPTHSIETAPHPDVLVIPGGGVRSILENEPLMAWIDECAKTSDIVASVCNGALVLARLGHLDGLEATTHHGSIARLRELTKDTVVHENRRFVDNGRFVTAAGISAGIDASLYLVAREHGEPRARSIARYMEYPYPDADAGVQAPSSAKARSQSKASTSSESRARAETTAAVSEKPLALGGMDPVALVCGEEIAGDESLVAEDDRYRYRFASERHRRAFVADAGRYRIEHGGACAGMRGETDPGTGQPGIYLVHGGRIYIFASDNCRVDFLTDPAGFVADLERARLRDEEGA